MYAIRDYGSDDFTAACKAFSLYLAGMDSNLGVVHSANCQVSAGSCSCSGRLVSPLGRIVSFQFKPGPDVLRVNPAEYPDALGAQVLLAVAAVGAVHFVKGLFNAVHS